MRPVAVPSERLSASRRLLGGWTDVRDEIRALCRALEELPDVCQCGHEPAHLSDACPCCGTTARERVPACNDCEEELARLRPAIDVMTVDTFRFFPWVKEFVSRHDLAAGSRVRDLERGIAALSASFTALVMAEGQFRTNCRASHLQTLKDAARALRAEANALDRIV